MAISVILFAGNNYPLVVVGNAGSGKSALLSNWLSRHQKRFPSDVLVYVFAGASEGSTSK